MLLGGYELAVLFYFLEFVGGKLFAENLFETRIEFEGEHAPEIVDEVLVEFDDIESGIINFRDILHRFFEIAGEDMAGECRRPHQADLAEDSLNRCQIRRVAHRNDLLEEGFSITQRAFGSGGDELKCRPVDFDFFLLDDLLELLDDDGDGKLLEMESLGAGSDGRRDLVEFGSGEDEEGVRRRLFERFQKGIGSGFGELVDFVDDEYLIGIRSGGKADTLLDIPDLVDAAVGSRVDFDDIERAALLDFLAGTATVARLALGLELWVFAAGFAVYDFRENPCGGCFSAAALAIEEIGVGDLVALRAVLKYFDHGFLADEVTEFLRTVFSINRERH